MPEVNPMMLLHGEEVVDFYKKIEPGKTYKMQESMVDASDKGKMGIFAQEAVITEKDTGIVAAKVYSTAVIRGLGGFGYKGKVKQPFPKIPTRDPDHVSIEPSYPWQAFLYRLSNDLNPLHVDPDMAALANFDKPIVHGLCSFGFSGRAIYEKYCNGKPDMFARIGCRFTSYVFPGETYVVEMWKEGNGVIF